MSVGLDALNKLQRDQAAAQGATPVASSSRPAPTPKPRRIAIIALVGALAVVLVVWRTKSNHRPESFVPIAAPETAPKVSVPAPAVVKPLLPAPVAQASPALPAAPAPLPPHPKPVQQPVKVAASIAPPTPAIIPVQPKRAAPPVPPKPVVPPAAPTFTLNPLVASFVGSIHVDGVRTNDGRAPIVLFGGAVYHLNEVVNAPLGIRLVGIEESRLTFQDAHGALYTKPFSGS